jgi:hypothetical protein
MDPRQSAVARRPWCDRRWPDRGRRGVRECGPSGAGSDFLFSDQLIGPKKGHAEINGRGGSLATHATGGDFTGESGESVVQADLGNTLA